ncbi:MAG: hypothetical protein PCFJNLEI_03453 [Verrucomicrobiae bacterium]|nr:hypothetical protein [Verrucomicrobiae bacterium]
MSLVGVSRYHTVDSAVIAAVATPATDRSVRENAWASTGLFRNYWKNTTAFSSTVRISDRAATSGCSACNIFQENATVSVRNIGAVCPHNQRPIVCRDCVVRTQTCHCEVTMPAL